MFRQNALKTILNEQKIDNFNEININTNISYLEVGIDVNVFHKKMCYLHLWDFQHIHH